MDCTTEFLIQQLRDFEAIRRAGLFEQFSDDLAAEREKRHAADPKNNAALLEHCRLFYAGDGHPYYSALGRFDDAKRAAVNELARAFADVTGWDGEAVFDAAYQVVHADPVEEVLAKWAALAWARLAQRLEKQPAKGAA